MKSIKYSKEVHNVAIVYGVAVTSLLAIGATAILVDNDNGNEWRPEDHPPRELVELVPTGPWYLGWYFHPTNTDVIYVIPKRLTADVNMDGDVDTFDTLAFWSLMQDAARAEEAINE